MKTEMQMLPNGNYESVISFIQHKCTGEPHIWECIEFGCKEGLFLKMEDGDPYEDGVSYELEVNYCPFCGYKKGSS